MPSRSACAAYVAGPFHIPKLSAPLAFRVRSLGVVPALLLLSLGGPQAAAKSAADAPPAVEVDRLIRTYRDPPPTAELVKAERRFIPYLSASTTAGLDGPTLLSLKRMMVLVMLRHDRTTYECNRLVAMWKDDANPVGRALRACADGGGEGNACGLLDYRYPTIRQVMANFSTLYADPRLALADPDLAYWSVVLGCGQDRHLTPMPVVVKYISDLLLELTGKQVGGVKPFDMGVKDPDKFADFERVSRHKLYQRLGSECAADPPYEASLLRAMECRATLLGKD